MLILSLIGFKNIDANASPNEWYSSGTFEFLQLGTTQSADGLYYLDSANFGFTYPSIVPVNNVPANEMDFYMYDEDGLGSPSWRNVGGLFSNPLEEIVNIHFEFQGDYISVWFEGTINDTSNTTLWISEPNDIPGMNGIMGFRYISNNLTPVINAGQSAFVTNVDIKKLRVRQTTVKTNELTINKIELISFKALSFIIKASITKTIQIIKASKRLLIINWKL